MMTLKKTFTLWIALLAVVAGAWAQTNTTIRANKVETNELKVKTRNIKGISTRGSISGSGSNDSLMTQNAIKAYVTSVSSSGVSDGDKGDITVSGTGSVWTIDADVIAWGKLSSATKDSIIAGKKRVSLRASKPSTTYLADIVVDTVGTDSLYVWNASGYMLLQTGSGGGGSPTGSAGGDLTGTYPNPTIGSGKVISDNILDGTIVNADLAGQTVDSNKIKNRAITTDKLKDDAVTAAKIGAGEVGASELASTAVTAGSYTSANITVDADGRITSAANGSGSSGAAYTSFDYIIDTIPATGLAANESVANYPVTQIDSAQYSFTTAALAGQRGGWLANGTSGDSVAVSVPFWVVIGDSQAEGHPARHGRLHPSGVAGFFYNYPDSIGTLSYHLSRLTKFPWINQGIGGQTSEQVLWRYDRDAIGLTTTPIGGADSRGTKTLNRRPIGVVIIVGANDVFTSGWNAQRTKANILAMCQKSAQVGQYIVVLTVPGNANILTPAQDKYVEEVNGWLKSGALNRYGAVIVDYNKWWRDPTWNDNAHPDPTKIVDQVHPSLVGYDSLANYIFRTAKLPVLRTAIIRNQVAPTGGVSGFSRPTSISIHGTPYTISNAVDSAVLTAPITRDSAFFKITASTNVTGTTYSGFSHIQWVWRNSSGGLYQKSRHSGNIGYLEIQGSSQSANNTNLLIKDQYGLNLFRVRDDGSVFSNGKGSEATNTFYGQSTNQSWTSGTNNTGFGQFTMFSLTSGSGNSALGVRSLFSCTSGSQNTAFGYYALTALTTGGNNVAFGHNSMISLTTGSSNVAFGLGALATNSTSSDNTAVGTSALTSTTAAGNSALGRLALFSLTSGADNTAVGRGAAQELTTSSSSTFIGLNAGRYQTGGATALQTAANSVYVGALTKGSANGVTNENVFGYNATGNGSNTVTIGDANITATYLRGGILAAGTTTMAPLKFTSGALLTTPEAGTLGYDGTEFYATNSTASRAILARVLKGSATLDFASTAAGAVTDLTITVSGAADGDVVSLSVPNASQTATGTFSAWVSATNTVTVRYRIAALTGSEDPASGTFKVTVTK